MMMGMMHTGKTITEISVKAGWMARRTPKVQTIVTGSLTMDAKEPPTMLYSTCVSLVMRAIKSPVLARLKNPSERFCRWLNNFARMSAIARMADQFVE